MVTYTPILANSFVMFVACPMQDTPQKTWWKIITLETTSDAHCVQKQLRVDICCFDFRG